MLRTMLIHPVLIAAATVLVLIVGRMSGHNPSAVSIVAAAAIALVASELAVVPLLLNKSKNPADVFLRAFFGTILHLVLSVILGALAIFGLKLGGIFVYWLLGAYWITLIGLCIVFVRVLRTPVQSAKLSAN